MERVLLCCRLEISCTLDGGALHELPTAAPGDLEPAAVWDDSNAVGIQGAKAVNSLMVLTFLLCPLGTDHNDFPNHSPADLNAKCLGFLKYSLSIGSEKLR